MLDIKVRARKGALLSALKAEVDTWIAVHGTELPRVAAVALRVRRSVALLLSEVPNGSVVSLQLTVDQDPLAQWSVGLLMSVSPPPLKEARS